MRLLRLAMKNFGPYAKASDANRPLAAIKPTVIDFERLYAGGKFMIMGDTGSGKTMILDAISFALFGKAINPNARPDRLLVGQAVKKTGSKAAMEVAVTFVQGKKKYCITRAMTLNEAKKTDRTIKAILTEITGAKVVVLADKQQAVAEKIAQIIHLTHEQFATLVVLPQGDFAKFLDKDTTQKAALLRPLFNTQQYVDYTDALRQHKKALTAAVGDDNYATVSAIRQFKWQNVAYDQAKFAQEIIKADARNVATITLDNWLKQLADALAEQKTTAKQLAEVVAKTNHHAATLQTRVNEQLAAQQLLKNHATTQALLKEQTTPEKRAAIAAARKQFDFARIINQLAPVIQAKHAAQKQITAAKEKLAQISLQQKELKTTTLAELQQINDQLHAPATVAKMAALKKQITILDAIIAVHLPAFMQAQTDREVAQKALERTKQQSAHLRDSRNSFDEQLAKLTADAKRLGETKERISQINDAKAKVAALKAATELFEQTNTAKQQFITANEQLTQKQAAYLNWTQTKTRLEAQQLSGTQQRRALDQRQQLVHYNAQVKQLEDLFEKSALLRQQCHQTKTKLRNKLMAYEHQKANYCSQIVAAAAATPAHQLEQTVQTILGQVFLQAKKVGYLQANLATKQKEIEANAQAIKQIKHAVEWHEKWTVKQQLAWIEKQQEKITAMFSESEAATQKLTQRVVPAVQAAQVQLQQAKTAQAIAAATYEHQKEKMRQTLQMLAKEYQLQITEEMTAHAHTQLVAATKQAQAAVQQLVAKQQQAEELGRQLEKLTHQKAALQSEYEQNIAKLAQVKNQQLVAEANYQTAKHQLASAKKAGEIAANITQETLELKSATIKQQLEEYQQKCAENTEKITQTTAKLSQLQGQWQTLQKTLIDAKPTLAAAKSKAEQIVANHAELRKMLADETKINAAINEWTAGKFTQLTQQIADYDSTIATLSRQLKQQLKQLKATPPLDKAAFATLVLKSKEQTKEAQTKKLAHQALRTVIKDNEGLLKLAVSHHQNKAKLGQRLQDVSVLLAVATGNLTKANLGALAAKDAGQTLAHTTLEQFVLRQQLEVCVAFANTFLTNLQSGRYTLQLRSANVVGIRAAQALEIDVVDALEQGRIRPAATLSGGERFCVSLALALGLAEQFANASGEKSLGVLFLDEGFGTLDEATLSEVMKALEKLRFKEQGSLLGIISHVQAIKTIMPAVLEVTAATSQQAAKITVHSREQIGGLC